jgi:hypothetical protein
MTADECKNADRALLVLTTKSGAPIMLRVDIVEVLSDLEVRVCVNESAEGFMLVVALADIETCRR